MLEIDINPNVSICKKILNTILSELEGENISMTSIYLIRHSQPNHEWENDRTRPLTDGGLEDNKKVTEFLRNIKIDYYK